ncbi:hypothetical protein F5Y13DRAFT_196264 [Hypoxylon sp. FL1857]|nr:hypothetical protein F5Y13DRAFT_196264 [Hypoxylon sp. FL1857]
MEALAAFSVAANVAQFIAIAGKAVEKTLELSRNRQTLLDENADLERIVKSFTSAVPVIRRADSAKLEDDRKLKFLADDALLIAAEIQAKFDKIKARRSSRKRSERLMVTLKELRMKGELESLNSRLSTFRSEITLHINLKLLEHQEQIRCSLNGNTESNHAYKKQIQTQLSILIEEVKSKIIPVDETEVWRGNSENLESLEHGLSYWYPQMVDFQKTQKIVSGLQFNQIEERRNAIQEAHTNTYKRVFDCETANFKTWLTTRSAPTYWITGNAGSGKSTLMKYIYEHPRLRASLKDWAGGRDLYIASHFFWSGGTPMQQSQEGLLRTLLFQILLERPELTPRAFPTRWNDPLGCSQTSGTLKWTVKELLDALFSLASALSPDFLFIFIDGLDEDGGEHDKLLKIIESLGRGHYIKLCVSSRPWPDFLDAFEGVPWKLYLQDLTRSDIETYVRDHLESHSRFTQLSLRDKSSAQELVCKIISRAQGVFLWVYLVVKSMIRGFINADSVRDLHRRLDGLPQQLEAFFDRILDSIDEFYRSRTARVFLTLAHARTSMTLISFYFLDEEEGFPFNLESFLRNWPDVNEVELEVINTKKRQLIAQCKDLIQIVEQPVDPILFNFTASFLHRTVIDYINQPRTTEMLFDNAGPDFSPMTTLFEINARQFQSLIHLLPRVYLKPYLSDWYLASVYYAREVEVYLSKSKTQRLDEMTDSLIRYLGTRTTTRYSFSQAISMLLGNESIYKTIPFPDSFLDLAVQCGLHLYVSDKVQDETKASRNILLQSLKPTIHIIKDSRFRLGINEDAQRKPVPPATRQIYDSTFSMFTTSEAEMFRQLRIELEQQTPHSPTISENREGSVSNHHPDSLPPTKHKAYRYCCCFTFR